MTYFGDPTKFNTDSLVPPTVEYDEEWFCIQPDKHRLYAAMKQDYPCKNLTTRLIPRPSIHVMFPTDSDDTQIKWLWGWGE